MRAPRRDALRRRVARPTHPFSTAFLLGLLVAAPAAALPAPRLRGLVKSARVVAAGEVAAVHSYDDDRVAVVDFAVDRVLKGSLPGAPPFRLSLVELHEGPSRTTLTAGTRGLAFLRPASRTSYLARVLPSGTYYEVLPEFGSFVSASSKDVADRQTAVASRVVETMSGRGMDSNAARALTFELLAAENPLLVEDAAAGLAELRDQPKLSAEELGVLRAALLRADLRDRVRVAVIEAVGKGGIRDAVPTLQSIAAPPAAAEAAWRVLDQLGAGPPEKSLEQRLANPDPGIRAAAVRELLRRDGAAGVSQVGPVAIQDPDPAVRKAAVEALGALGKPEGLAPLERIFADSPTDLQQAAARAIQSIGGQPAIDSCERLAFSAPPDAQRYAVLVLMTMNDPRKQAALDHIAATHPDAQIRDLVTKGLQFHEH